MRYLRTLALPALAASCLCLGGCRSAFVQTAIVNHSGDKAQLIEVDYPSASFGTQQIADNATYHYKFKIQGSGPVKITFTGAENKIYTVTGPNLDQGQRGTLIITLDPSGKVSWTPELAVAK